MACIYYFHVLIHNGGINCHPPPLSHLIRQCCDVREWVSGMPRGSSPSGSCTPCRCNFSSLEPCQASILNIFQRTRFAFPFIWKIFIQPIFAHRCVFATNFCPPFQNLLSERLTSLGITGAPEVPPLCRETSVSRTANIGTVGMNGLRDSRVLFNHLNHLFLHEP